MRSTCFKIVIMLLSFSLILSTIGCSNTEEYSTDPGLLLKYKIEKYEKTKDSESLVEIIFYAVDYGNFEIINKYGELFFFPESKNEFEYLKQTFLDQCSNRYKYFIDEDNIDVSYEMAIWLYMFSYVVDFDTLKSKSYIEIESKINEVFPKCFDLLNVEMQQSNIAISAMKNYLDAEEFPKYFIGILNLFAINKSETLTEKVYMYSWEISNVLNISPANKFFIGVISNGKYYKDISIKNPAGNGILKKQYSKEELITIFDSFANSETTNYSSVMNTFSVLPKEYANGCYYTFHYYTDDFILSFHGSPVHGMTISNADTGCIIYTRVKMPSYNGLKWTNKYGNGFENGQLEDGSMIDTENE